MVVMDGLRIRLNGYRLCQNQLTRSNPLPGLGLDLEIISTFLENLASDRSECLVGETAAPTVNRDDEPGTDILGLGDLPTILLFRN